MQDAASELPRIRLLRAWVNKPPLRCVGLGCVACSEVLVAESTYKVGGRAVVGKDVSWIPESLWLSWWPSCSPLWR
jgi:hypothetical protein